MRLWPFAALLCCCAAAQAQTVACHITYGGETRRIEAGPTRSPYTVPIMQIGSYFLFKLVFEQGTAVKTYVYADRDAGPTPLHQATYAWPAHNAGAHGFSGLHFVYEPVRDGELEYWCERR